MDLFDIAEALEQKFSSDSSEMSPVTSWTIDSRKVKKGSIFVCIQGEHSDGHDFINDAIKNGANAILAQKPVKSSIPVFLVEDTIKALGKIAKYQRNKCEAKVITITGTAGKTTLKETLYSILSQNAKTGRSYKNYNTQIGMPISILNMDGDEQYWILEAGISHPKDMDELGNIAEPDIAIILNVGAGHEEGLGDKGIAWHKARLLSFLKKEGWALISRDYQDLFNEIKNYNVNKIFFGVNNPGKYIIKETSPGSYIIKDDKDIAIETPFAGEYGAEICISAWTCAKELNISDEQIVKGLLETNLPEHRFSINKIDNFTVIEDCYNANPLSMERMLKAASTKAKQEKFIVVLGPMLELGNKAQFWHRELGKQLAQINPDLIFWKGEFLEDVNDGYRVNGGKKEIHALKNDNEFFEQIIKTSRHDKTTIFFKGSRKNKLEENIENFKNNLKGAKNVL